MFANWGKPSEGVTSGVWFWIWHNKWLITGFFSLVLAFSMTYVLRIAWWQVVAVVAVTAASAFLSAGPIIPMIVGITGLSLISLLDKKEEDNREWILSTWSFAKQIIPLLAIGVVIAGFLLGSTHEDTAIRGIVPSEWIASLVGGNSLFSNFFASFVGAFMYFATLTEVPIVQGLISAGMGKGPALALLLAGPSLSLPNMLVIRGVLGTKKTVVYVSLVILMATITGLIFGSINF